MLEHHGPLACLSKWTLNEAHTTGGCSHVESDVMFLVYVCGGGSGTRQGFDEGVSRRRVIDISMISGQSVCAPSLRCPALCIGPLCAGNLYLFKGAGAQHMVLDGPSRTRIRPLDTFAPEFNTLVIFPIRRCVPAPLAQAAGAERGLDDPMRRVSNGTRAHVGRAGLALVQGRAPCGQGKARAVLCQVSPMPIPERMICRSGSFLGGGSEGGVARGCNCVDESGMHVILHNCSVLLLMSTPPPVLMGWARGGEIYVSWAPHNFVPIWG